MLAGRLADLFHATIGGCGSPGTSSSLNSVSARPVSLDRAEGGARAGLSSLPSAAASVGRGPFTVSWVDCLWEGRDGARRADLGTWPSAASSARAPPEKRAARVPVDLPEWC